MTMRQAVGIQSYQALVRSTRGLVFFWAGGSTAARTTGSNYALPPRFTMECWVNWSSVAANRGIFGNWAGNNGVMLFVDGTFTYIRAAVNATSVPGGTGILTGTWYHLAAVYDGTTVSVYANAGLTTTGTTVNPNAVSSPLVTHNYASSGIGDLAGTVADAAIYARALSITELRRHYVVGLATHK